MRIILSVFLSFFCFLPGAWAEPKFEARLEPSTATTVEAVIFSIQAEWSKAEARYQFAFPPLNLLENLKVVNQGEAQESFAGTGGEWIRKTFTFELRGQKAGPAKIPSFEVSYIAPEQQISGSFTVPAQTLRIHNPFNPAPFLICAAVLGLSGAVFLWIREASRRKNSKLAEEAKNNPEPGRNLEQFKNFVENNSFLTPQYKTELPDHLKRFLVDAYGIDLGKKSLDAESVTVQLAEKGLGREESYELKTVLKKWEEINYAGRISDAEFREFRGQMMRLIQNKKSLSI